MKYDFFTPRHLSRRCKISHRPLTFSRGVGAGSRWNRGPMTQCWDSAPLSSLLRHCWARHWMPTQRVCLSVHSQRVQHEGFLRLGIVIFSYDCPDFTGTHWTALFITNHINLAPKSDCPLKSDPRSCSKRFRIRGDYITSFFFCFF